MKCWLVSQFPQRENHTSSLSAPQWEITLASYSQIILNIYHSRLNMLIRAKGPCINFTVQLYFVNIAKIEIMEVLLSNSKYLQSPFSKYSSLNMSIRAKGPYVNCIVQLYFVYIRQDRDQKVLLINSKHLQSPSSKYHQHFSNHQVIICTANTYS